MNFQDFLPLMDAGLDVLAQKVEGSAADSSVVQFVPDLINRETLSDLPCIWIGTGRWDALGKDDICLNNKGANTVFNLPQRLSSITELLEQCPDQLVSQWQQVLGNKKAPADVFNRFYLMIEDASPDSCFGFLCFLAMINGVDVEDIPESWRDYIKRWESGDVISTGTPENSYGALHSAIYHSLIEAGWGQAWVSSLRFMVNSLKQNINPEDMSAARPWGGLVQARSLVEFERQAYLDSLGYATTIQLLVPIAGSQGRSRLIDAYLAEEHVPLGLLKNFLRTDTQNTVLKSGFTLMGVYKPHDPAAGDFLAISLTPDTGLHLGDLWEELERLEDQSRETPRDCDHPRTDVILYPEGKRKDGSPSPNNPWYITVDKTLVAAPYAQEGANPGTTLEWNDVIEALWRCYHPFRDLQITNLSGQACALDHCQPYCEHETGSGGSERKKKLVLARWHKSNEGASQGGSQFFMRFSPTLNRFLAACIEKDDEQDVRLQDLPEQDHFDYIEFKGGFGVISSQGAYIIDDWRREILDTEGVSREFNHVLKRRQIIDQMSEQADELYAVVEQKLRLGLSSKDSSELLNRIAAMQLTIGKQWNATNPSTFDSAIINFRSHLEKRFGIEGRLESFYQAVERISSMLNSYIELRTNTRVAWLTIFGFPIALLSAFFGFIFEDMPSCPVMPEWFPSSLCEGINLNGLGLFLMMVLLSITVFKIWNWRQEVTSRLKPEDFKSRS